MSISMDFIEGEPKPFGTHVILVVVDRFSKAAHFSALPHPNSTLDVAPMHLDNVFKLYG